MATQSSYEEAALLENWMTALLVPLMSPAFI
jgi:hypothetical protein